MKVIAAIFRNFKSLIIVFLVDFWHSLFEGSPYFTIKN